MVGKSGSHAVPGSRARRLRSCPPRDSKTNTIPRLRPFRSLLITGLLQIAAFICIISLTALPSLPLSPVILHALVALVFARLARLTAPWQLCNVLIPFCLVANTGSWVPFSLFLVSLLIFGPTLRAPIPFYPTRPGVYEHLADTIATHAPRQCVDLGSGFGSVLFALASRFPSVTFEGYEIGLMPLFFSRIRSWGYPNVAVHRESFWTVHLGRFDLVYAFLAPPPMGDLEEKLSRELADHALFITNSFPLPHSLPFHTTHVGGQSLLFYRRADIRVGNDSMLAQISQYDLEPQDRALQHLALERGEDT